MHYGINIINLQHGYDKYIFIYQIHVANFVLGYLTISGPMACLAKTMRTAVPARRHYNDHSSQMAMEWKKSNSLKQQKNIKYLSSYGVIFVLPTRLDGENATYPLSLISSSSSGFTIGCWGDNDSCLRHWGTIAVIFVWLRCRKCSTAIWIPRHEKYLPFPWLQ